VRDDTQKNPQGLIIYRVVTNVADAVFIEINLDEEIMPSMRTFSLKFRQHVVPT